MHTRVVRRRSSPVRASHAALAVAALAVAALLGAAGSASAQYTPHNLVSDQPGVADHQDPNLVNAWGIAFNPTGFAWVADNHSGLSTLYDGNGVANSLVVNIPSPSSLMGGSPTGMVFSGGSDFVINNGAGVSGPARFIFATEDGNIAGWSPAVPPPPPSTQAFNAVNNPSANAVYKGLTLATGASGSRLFAADFHNNRIDAFDGTFAPVTPSGGFHDATLPVGYAPFNAKAINNRVYVTYAQQDAAGHDDVPGAGHGFVDVFDLDGNLLNRLVSGGALNSPWGMSLAPAGFGAFSGDLLVGNFGDGTINAYDPNTGQFRGTLTDAGGNVVTIGGLWAIEFGNGVLNQPINTLFFSAGPGGEEHGLYGRIDVVPAPGAAALLGAGLLLAGRRRRTA